MASSPVSVFTVTDVFSVPAECRMTETLVISGRLIPAFVLSGIVKDIIALLAPLSFGMNERSEIVAGVDTDSSISILSR